jgi:uncharacterized Zn-finger protein
MKNHIRNIHSKDENYSANLDPWTPVEIRENNAETEDKDEIDAIDEKLSSDLSKVDEKLSSSKKRYSCNICGRMLSCKQSLERHLKIHLGLKPHKV